MLANMAGQITQLLLTHRVRQQAGSYKGFDTYAKSSYGEKSKALGQTAHLRPRRNFMVGLPQMLIA